MRLQTYTKISPQVNEFVERASPVVKGTLEEVNKVAAPAAREFATKAVPTVTVCLGCPRRPRHAAALRGLPGRCPGYVHHRVTRTQWRGGAHRRAPHVQESTRGLLKSSGVDVDVLSKTAGEATKTVSDAATVASPTVTKIVSFLTTADPATLGKTAVALVAAYYLLPFAVKYAFSSVRGYSGAPSCSPLRLCLLASCLWHRVLLGPIGAWGRASVGVSVTR